MFKFTHAYVCLVPERGVSISGYFWRHKDCATLGRPQCRISTGKRYKE